MALLRDSELAGAFDHAAGTYDRMTSASPGYHRHLRRSARRLALPGLGAGWSVLDLGCGTGASTAALLRAAPLASVTGVDASVGMLARARSKAWSGRATFVHASAEGMTGAGVTGPYDAVFAAYLFRNVTDPDAVLGRVRDVLRPGGRLAVHEYALSGRAVDRALWSAVMAAVVLPWGRSHGDGALYRHLWRSVLDFDTADAFARRLRRAGFTGVRVLPQPGWQTGITHTFVATRP
ncbi:methyltransferase [Streptomyces litmocidini]|uniref:class I SAM-dependent methyltransferase n=1 Tax=Streptomyces litmocidini TaxID=67318 RepID=UPI00167E600D|nr:class I SAM-dependent methyltransferase [Streptomyces litmocidini]GGU97212.1 methyltransferase [Streptomyces litmocidini]